jgi:hypothetical protein
MRTELTIDFLRGYMTVNEMVIRYNNHAYNRKIDIEARGTLSLKTGKDAPEYEITSNFVFDNGHKSLTLSNAELWPTDVDPLIRRKIARYIKLHAKACIKEALGQALEKLIHDQT